MRRLIVEFHLKDFAGMKIPKKVEAELNPALHTYNPASRESASMISAFQKVKSFQILNFLKQSREESAFICRLCFKDPTSKIKELSFLHLTKVQVLEKEDKKGSYTLFVKAKPQTQTNLSKIRRRATMPDVYLTNLETSDEVVKSTFLGSSRAIQNLLRMYEKIGMHHKILSLMDARFPANSPLSRLTERQREVLSTAYSLGYYDLPRRINSDQLASKLGLVNSTFVAHRRKAEQKILSEIFSAK